MRPIRRDSLINTTPATAVARTKSPAKGPTRADDSEVRELAFRGVVHSYQTSGDRLSFVSIEPFAEE